MENLLQKILAGQFDHRLEDIVQVCVQRKKTVAYNHLHALQPGDHAHLKDRMNPMYLAGMPIKIVKIMQSWAIVDLPEPIIGPNGKRWHANIRVPSTLIVP